MDAHIQTLPKIELHRHLEGSWRLQTLCDIAREYCLPIPAYDLESMRPYVQIMPDTPRTWAEFLGKFRFIRQFFRSKTIIQRVTREIVADAAADNIRYMELRFTPQALNNIMGCEYGEVVAWVCQASQKAAAELGIQVRLIVSMNRHESVAIGEAVIEAALAYRNEGVVGIDLAGQEDGFPCIPFESVFERAKREGLGVTVHAGEWMGSDSIRQSVETIKADRIGHGIRVVEDMALVEQLAARGTVFEVCPTSNVDSGVVARLEDHPLRRMLQGGLNITVNTDDPLISNITLSEQLAQVIQYQGLSFDIIKQLQINAANAAFLPVDQRAALLAQLDTV